MTRKRLTVDELADRIERLWETPGRNIIESMAHDGDTALGLTRARELMAKINKLRASIVAINREESVKRNRTARGIAVEELNIPADDYDPLAEQLGPDAEEKIAEFLKEKNAELDKLAPRPESRG